MVIRPDIEALKEGKIVQKTAAWIITEPYAPSKEIFEWVAHLEAENAQLEAHNRQLVEALQELMDLSNAPKPQCKIEYVPHNTVYCLGEDVPEFGPQTIDSEERKAYWDAFKAAKQALQTPAAKLAMAEAAVLRAVQNYMSICESVRECSPRQTPLYLALEAMQEARRLPMDATWNGYNEAGDSGLIAERLAELKQEAKGDA